MTLFGKHLWCRFESLDMTWGMWKRGVTGYRRCAECGRTQIRKTWYGWVDNGENPQRLSKIS